MSHLCVYISWPLQPSDWKRPMPGGPSWSKADCSCQTLEKMGPLSSDSSLGQRWEALRQPPFLVVNQIAMHGRDASWAVDTIWTFGKTCQDYHGITPRRQTCCYLAPPSSCFMNLKVSLLRLSWKVKRAEIPQHTPNHKDSSFSLVNDKEKQQILPFKKLELIHFWHLCWRYDNRSTRRLLKCKQLTTDTSKVGVCSKHGRSHWLTTFHIRRRGGGRGDGCQSADCSSSHATGYV